MAAKMAMMAMTTSSSIRVKATVWRALIRPAVGCKHVFITKLPGVSLLLCKSEVLLSAGRRDYVGRSSGGDIGPLRIDQGTAGLEGAWSGPGHMNLAGGEAEAQRAGFDWG